MEENKQKDSIKFFINKDKQLFLQHEVDAKKYNQETKKLDVILDAEGNPVKKLAL